MILDAVLLALADVVSAEQRCVAILPDMKFASGNGISIKNPVSGYELWLDGSVDYAVIEYDDKSDNKGQPDHDSNRLLIAE